MSKRVKQKIYPFFLPMRGCPQHCIYCDQHAIAGTEQPPTPQQVTEALALCPADREAEIAFYGGSFTCLPPAEQDAYLRAAAEAVAAGTAGGIRLSTRPDAVDEATCHRLQQAGVTTVELGIQSFDDTVLQATGRSYCAAQAEEACRTVKAHGMRLGVQLMTGLPQDDAQRALASMQKGIDLQADMVRIYPTLVLRHTPLADLYAAGQYAPQTLQEAVSTAASMLTLAEDEGVQVIRMGVHPSETLEQALVAGPYHPAFGGMVKEELRRRLIDRLLQGCDPAEPAMLRFCREELPLVFGQQRKQMMQLARQWPQLALMPDAGIAPGEVYVTGDGWERSLSAQQYCHTAAEELRRSL